MRQGGSEAPRARQFVRSCLSGRYHSQQSAGVSRHPRIPSKVRSRKHASASDSGSYRTSAFSWSLSNLVPKSRSMSSLISCQVVPAAFISFRTVSAFARERSAVSFAAVSSVRKAFFNASATARATASLFMPSFKGAIASLIRLALSQ